MLAKQAPPPDLRKFSDKSYRKMKTGLLYIWKLGRVAALTAVNSVPLQLATIKVDGATFLCSSVKKMEGRAVSRVFIWVIYTCKSHVKYDVCDNPF